MKVRELMERDVACARPRDNAGVLAETLWTKDCAFVPIVDEGRHVLGVVTDRDMAIALGTRGRRPSELAAEELMSRDVATCREDADVDEALATMQARQVRRLAVVDEGAALVGVVSLTDVARRAAPKGGVPYARVVGVLGSLRQTRAPQAQATPEMVREPAERAHATT